MTLLLQDLIPNLAELGENFRDLPIEARRTLIHSSTYLWMKNHIPSRFRPFRHTILLDRETQMCFQGHRSHRHLMVSMPPRVGKTASTMLYGATRYFCMNPSESVWGVTYSKSLASKFGYKCRQICEENGGELFGYEIDRRRSSAKSFAFKGHAGTFNVIGRGEGISGNDCHLILVDDLVKDSAEVRSPTKRNALWDWVVETLYQRIEDSEMMESKLISIGTRWHVDDYLGRSLHQEEAGSGIRFRKIILPAWAEHQDVKLDGEVIIPKGEALCEARLPLQQIAEIKRSRTADAYNAGYMCQPLAADGTVWREDLFGDDIWVDGFPPVEDIMAVTIGMDPATGKSISTGDYTAIVAVVATRGGKFYVYSELTKSGGYATIDSLHRVAHEVLPMLPDWVGIEDAAFQFLLKSDADDKFASDEDLIVEGVKNNGDPRTSNKQTRIYESLDAMFTYGDFRFVRCRGNHLLIRQARDFPNPLAHDDGLDGLEIAMYGFTRL